MLFKFLDAIFKKMGYIREENLVLSTYKYNSLRAKHVALHKAVSYTHLTLPTTPYV